MCVFPYVQPHLYTDTVQYPNAGEDVARIGVSSHLSQGNHHSSSQICPQTKLIESETLFSGDSGCVKLAAKSNHGNKGVSSVKSFLLIPGQKCLLLLFLFYL